MCGIAGLVDWGGRDRDAMTNVLVRMEQAVARRGPDGGGRDVVIGADGAVAYLAHRRLAILDRSDAGRQPMPSSDRRHWVTYNGEIYNYRDLRQGLAADGVHLRSTSDTEVLVEGLARAGTDFLTGVRGMFAFAQWDVAASSLTLARDRFGIKPLVFVRPSPDLLLFASTPQALAASGLWTLRADPAQRGALLAHGSIAADESFWQGVSTVTPGTTVQVARDRTTVRTYWSLDDVWRREREERPVAQVAASIRAAVDDSVRAHLVSDVPVAVFLSGGLDSSAVATAARAHTRGDLRSITVSLPGSSLDEGQAARRAAARIGTTHTEVVVETGDRDALLEEFLAALATPSVDGLNTFVVARAARMAGVQVALSGIGGDELFGGYPSFTAVPRLHAAVQRWGAAARLARPVLDRWRSPRVSKFAAIAAERPATLDEAWWAYRGLWSRADVRHLLGDAAADDTAASTPRVTTRSADPFDQVRDNEWRHFLQRQLLPDTDAVTMCRALELRTPLVDHVVVEAVAAAGRWPRGAHATWKAALFEAWPDWADAATRTRPKQGFVLPMDTWLREALTAPAPRVWADVAARLRVPPYADAVDRFLTGRLHWSRLWVLYVLERMESSGS